MTKRKWEPEMIEIPADEYEERVGKFRGLVRRLTDEAEGLNNDAEMYKKVSKYTKYTVNAADGDLCWLNRVNEAVSGILAKMLVDLEGGRHT